MKFDSGPVVGTLRSEKLRGVRLGVIAQLWTSGIFGGAAPSGAVALDTSHASAGGDWVVVVIASIVTQGQGPDHEFRPWSDPGPDPAPTLTDQNVSAMVTSASFSRWKSSIGR